MGISVAEQKLIIKTRIDERSLIVYIIESDMMDNLFTPDYKKALKDEIKNHKLAIKEYATELKELSKP